MHGNMDSRLPYIAFFMMHYLMGTYNGYKIMFVIIDCCVRSNVKASDAPRSVDKLTSKQTR